MISDKERQLLEVEASKCEAHIRAWDQSVKPFVEAKHAELYAAFINHPTTDEKGLMSIKMQANVLVSLEDQFKSYINSGKLARKQLEENTDEC